MNPRILLVTPASPFEPRSGAQQRSALLYDALRALGEVDVLLLEADRGPTRLVPPSPGLRAHAYWQTRPLGLGKYRPSAALSRLLAQAGVAPDRYDLIVGRYLNPICKLRLPRTLRSVVDLDDWAYHYSAPIASFGARLKSAYAAWLARRQLGRFDAYFLVSQRDAATLSGHRSAVLPNIPFAPPPRPLAAPDSTTLLFVGSLWYAPNREGIERFLARSWPLIRAARPDARLCLVGAAPEPVRRAWAQHDGVSAPGFVDDLEAAYRDAAFSIAPIRSGGGTNIKILESLAYGRACVTTPHCAAAFEAELQGAGLAVAETDADYARRCVAWLDAPQACASSAAAGYRALQSSFTRARFDTEVRKLCAVRP
jgi:glycosyltransferase involved in cell wall biosynthesis